MVVFIFPPIAKASEPPAGIACLSGALNAHKIPNTCIDANLEGQLYLLQQHIPQSDPWTDQAFRNRHASIQAMRDERTFHNIHHYRRIVRELNRLLAFHGKSAGVKISFTDYQDGKLLAVRTDHLLQASERFRENPFHDYYVKQLLPRIDDLQPQVIGLSLTYFSQAINTFALIGLLRKTYGKVEILLGGGLVTSWMSRPVWNNPFTGLVDQCVSGPGEKFILELLQVEPTSAAWCMPNLNDLPRNDYFAPGLVLPFNTSTGCYWKKCRFCPECQEDNAFRTRNKTTLLHELNQLISEYQPRLCHFLDNAIPPRTLQIIAQQRLPVPWYGYVRFTAELLDREFCMQLKNSGCVMLQLGLESGDQHVLDRMQKGIDLKNAPKILQNLKDAGIATYLYVLFGTPYETEDEANHTIDFVAQQAGCIDYLNAAVFNLPRFSLTAEELPLKEFYHGELSLYADFHHPAGWDRKKVRHFLDRRFKRHPDIAKILARTPISFTSDHAPFFVLQQKKALSKERAKFTKK